MEASLATLVQGKSDCRAHDRLFTWFHNGYTPGRFYPWMKMSAASAAAFDGFIARIGAVISGRRTYDVTNGFYGEGELPGAPLFVVTHHVPDQVPPVVWPASARTALWARRA